MCRFTAAGVRGEHLFYVVFDLLPQLAARLPLLGANERLVLLVEGLDRRHTQADHDDAEGQRHDDDRGLQRAIMSPAATAPQVTAQKIR